MIDGKWAETRKRVGQLASRRDDRRHVKSYELLIARPFGIREPSKHTTIDEKKSNSSRYDLQDRDSARKQSKMAENGFVLLYFRDAKIARIEKRTLDCYRFRLVRFLSDTLESREPR